MTCNGCVAKVKSSLLLVPGVTEVEVSKDEASATISMDKHIALSTFQHALGKKYTIEAHLHSEAGETAKSWLQTYKPVLLIFAYVLALSVITAFRTPGDALMQGMNTFMAGFFLSSSFFKLLNLRGFADSYAMYDIIAKAFPAWGYVYAFLEVALGLAYATHFAPVLTNLITLLVMSVSLVGVLQSVLNKRKILCACLGDVFKLPMSSLTVIEDGWMILMSAGMLILLLL